MLVEFILYFSLPIYGVIVMSIMLDVKWKNLCFKQKLDSSIFCVIIFVINVFFFFTKGMRFLSVLYPFMVQIPLMIGFYPLTRYRGYKLLFILLTVIMSAAPIVQVPHILAMVGIPFSVSRVVSKPVLYPLLVYIIYKWFSPLLHYALKYQKNGWGLLCVLPVVSYIVGMFIGKYNYTPDAFLLNASARIGLITITYAAYIVIFMFFKQSREYLLTQNENHLIKIQSAQALKEIETLRTSQEQTAVYRHDLRHHMNYLNTCISENKLQDAAIYIMQTCEDIDNIKVDQYSQNEPINLIISSYVSKAKKKGVPIQINVSATDFARFQITDLCSLISNALENAIIACAQVETVSECFIKLRIYEKNNKLCLDIRNSYATEPSFESGIPVSRKDRHGIGVKSMIHVVEKYGGVYGFSTKEKVFIFQVSM